MQFDKWYTKAYSGTASLYVQRKIHINTSIVFTFQAYLVLTSLFILNILNS